MLYRLNRLSRIHNVLREAAYAVLFRLPDAIKYGIGYCWRRFRQPYKLLETGDTAIQIGAPWDTLKAGRSRAAYFAHFAGNVGRVIALEPEQSNVDALQSYADRHSLNQLSIVRTALWSEKTRLRFLVDPEHPAANLVEAVIAEGRDRSGLETTHVDADTLDNVLAKTKIDKIKLLSITTNGSELEILRGASKTLAHVEYVSIITPQANELLSEHGFSACGEDDRGYLFRKSLLA